MKKLSFTTIAIFLFTLLSNAQTAELSLISTAGGVFTSKNESLTFTVGEIVTETFSSNDLIITQGFLQPYSKPGVGLPQETESQFSINIYPNPASNFFNIEVLEHEKYLMNVLDLNGKIIETRPLIEHSTKIDISNYYSGTYFIILTNNSKSIQESFVLVKVGK